MTSLVLVGCGSISSTSRASSEFNEPELNVVLTGLDNPRGIALGQAGGLFVVEAGTGYDAVDPSQNTGKLTEYIDWNGDGDFEDVDETERWFSHLPTYNSLQFFDTHRDEVSGPGDVLIHPDGRLYLSVDGGLDEIGLFEISPEGRVGRNLYSRGNMNGLAFDIEHQLIYAAASTANQLAEISLDGDAREILTFPPLESGQQAVPAGVAVDPRTGEVLVALFSGAAIDPDTGEVIPFVPGDARIVRVDPITGNFTDEVSGLTTAVDVAVDEVGNVFVVEMASGYADLLPSLYDLFDPQAPPLHGGYVRYSGRITLYPVGGSAPIVLAEGLDMPTNITLAPDGSIYVSTGQGTPGRPIPGPEGPTFIVGEVLRISNIPERYSTP